MSIVEFDGPPSWSLDANETGERTKSPWVEAVGLIASTTPTHGDFVLSPWPVSLASRNQDAGPSKSTINIYDHGKIGESEQSIVFVSVESD